jgi:hypothetical protein
MYMFLIRQKSQNYQPSENHTFHTFFRNLSYDAMRCFQFTTRLDDRLKTIETNVTKSVGELDDIKKTVRNLASVSSPAVSLNPVNTRLFFIERHLKSSSVLFISFRSNLKAFRSY